MRYKHVRGGEVWWDDNPENAEMTLHDYARAYEGAKARGDWRAIENARGAFLGAINADVLAELLLKEE